MNNNYPKDTKFNQVIDFIKGTTKNPEIIERIYNDENLIWHSKKETLSHFDQEQIFTKESKTYKGVLFCFYSGRLEILFRPHYYFNENLHNANDFPVSKCIEVFKELKQIINPNHFSEINIVNIEFGLNILSPIPIENLINWISYHNKNEFKSDNPGLAHSKKSFTAKKNGRINTYQIIKAYAKGIQFPEYTLRDTFRFEIKSKKTQYIKKLGINTLEDLIKPETYFTLSNEFKNQFQKVLILDHTAESRTIEISSGEEKKLFKYLNTHHWYNIIKDKNRNKFSYHKNQYFKILDNTGYNIHEDLNRIIEQKLEELLIGENDAVLPPKKEIKNDVILPAPKKVKNEAILPSYIGEICTNAPQRICPVTGLDISMQNNRRKYLTASGIKYYRKKDPQLFEILKQKLLTGRPNKFEKTDYSKMAKQIRNRKNNNPGRYATEQTTLSI